MMRFVVALFALALLIVSPAVGRKKPPNRSWRMGTVLDSQRSQDVAGTVDMPGMVINGKRWTPDSKEVVYRVHQTVVIQTETHTYTVLETPDQDGKPANLTINGSVKFAIEDTTLYLIDENGKEHKGEIVKKALRKE